MDKLYYTAGKSWSIKAFYKTGDYYYLLFLGLVSGYQLYNNFTVLWSGYAITLLFASAIWIYASYQNIFIYPAGFIARFFLFLAIIPVGFLANWHVTISGMVCYTFIWYFFEDKSVRFIPQGLLIYLSVVFFGFVIGKNNVISDVNYQFFNLREPELSGIAFIPQFFRNEIFHLRATFSALEGFGLFGLAIIPVLLLRKPGFLLSFIIILSGFYASYDNSQLEMAVVWAASTFQPGKKVFEHEYVSMISSASLALLLFVIWGSLLPPIFFIILYFLIEGISLLIFSKIKQVLL